MSASITSYNGSEEASDTQKEAFFLLIQAAIKTAVDLFLKELNLGRQELQYLMRNLEQFRTAIITAIINEARRKLTEAQKYRDIPAPNVTHLILNSIEAVKISAPKKITINTDGLSLSFANATLPTEIVIGIILKELNLSRWGLQTLVENGQHFRPITIEVIMATARKLLLGQLPEDAPLSDFARLTLGRHFITPEMISSAKKEIIYSKEQQQALARTVPFRQIITLCKEYRFMLIAGPPQPLSFVKICGLKSGPKSGNGGLSADDSRFARAFKEDLVTPTWLAVHLYSKFDKDFGHMNMSWYQQLQLIARASYKGRVLNIAEEAWAAKILRAVTGKNLLGVLRVRTSSLCYSGHHMFLGPQDDKGRLSVGVGFDNDYWHGMGLAIGLELPANS